MERAQGSLEYLILIAVVLAIISVVTMIAVGYIGSQQGKYSYNTCKNAAANCKAALAANPNDKCGYCDTECKNPDGTDISTKASTCCKMGKPDSVYEGATGDDCNACFSDTDCTPKVCNPLTKKCVTPACMAVDDPICPDPNPATTGDGLCVSRLCVNPGAYNAYCDTGGKKEPTTVKCGDQAPALACLADKSGYTTTATPLYCDGLGVCNRPGTPTVTTTPCATTRVQTKSCDTPTGIVAGDYVNLKNVTTYEQCVSTPSVQCQVQTITDVNTCSYWTGCRCTVCIVHAGGTCLLLNPSINCGRSLNCMDCTANCGVSVCQAMNLCHFLVCNQCD